MKYTNIGAEVTVPATLVQATIALDTAAAYAQQTRDQDMMYRVAEGWMKLAGLLADLEESQPTSPEEKLKMGFQPNTENEEEEKDARSDDE